MLLTLDINEVEGISRAKLLLPVQLATVLRNAYFALKVSSQLRQGFGRKCVYTIYQGSLFAIIPRHEYGR